LYGAFVVKGRLICFGDPFFGSTRAASILPFSNRDGKSKRKTIDLASLSSFQVISLV
jgi:hypothetical protein